MSNILDHIFNNQFGFQVLLEDNRDKNLQWMVKKYREFRIANTNKTHAEAVNHVLANVNGPHLSSPDLVGSFVKAANDISGHAYFPEF